MNPQEFAQKIKEKYPQYQGMDDTELAQRVVEKYPQYKNKVVFDAPKEEKRGSGLNDNPLLSRKNIDKAGSFVNKLVSPFMESFTKRRDNIGEAITTDQNPLSAGLQTAGEVAGTVGDMFGAVISPVVEGVSDKIADIPAVQKVAMGDFGTNVLTGAQDIFSRIDNFSKEMEAKDPEKAKNVKALAEVLMLVLGEKPVQKTLEGTYNTAKQGFKTALNTTDDFAKQTADEFARANIQRIEQQATKQAEKTLEYVTPKPSELTPTQYKEALRQGKITPKTATSEATYNLSQTEREVALKYSKVIDKDPVKTSINILDEVDRLDTEVGNFLRENNGIYNKGELRNRLSSALETVDDITIDSARLASAKQKLVDNFLNALKKNDMETLWKARKKFDHAIESAFRGSPSVQKEIKIQFRNAIQDYIAERTPNDVYKGYMKDMRNLLKLQETVGTKASKERLLSGLQKWAKDHPKSMLGIKYGVGGLGLGVLGGSFLD